MSDMMGYGYGRLSKASVKGGWLGWLIGLFAPNKWGGEPTVGRPVALSVRLVMNVAWLVLSWSPKFGWWVWLVAVFSGSWLLVVWPASLCCKVVKMTTAAWSSRSPSHHPNHPWTWSGVLRGTRTSRSVDTFVSIFVIVSIRDKTSHFKLLVHDLNAMTIHIRHGKS